MGNGYLAQSVNKGQYPPVPKLGQSEKAQLTTHTLPPLHSPTTIMDGASPQPEANGSTARKRTPWQPPNPLETAPADATNRPDGGLPNTPLMMSCIAFCLGSVFAMGSLVFAIGGVPGSRYADYRLGFFAASWAFFHFAEFAVTAGWNRPKVSVDCE